MRRSAVILRDLRRVRAAILCVGLWCSATGLAATAPTRTVGPINLPGVTLVNQDAQRVTLGSLVDPGKPALVQFVFTTCKGICPVLATTFANLQKSLGKNGESTLFLSVSIDPDNDTPQVGRAWLKRFGATGNWQFLTGTLSDIRQVTKAFSAYTEDKMTHAPLTFLWSPREKAWVRLSGFVANADLLADYQKAVAP